jgi:hypothetical protein
MPNAPDLLPSLVISGLLILLVVGLLRIVSVALRRIVSGHRTNPDAPESPKSTPPWICLLLIVVVGVITNLTMPRRGGGGPVGAPPLLRITLMPIGVGIVVLAGLILVRWLRNRDPVSIRAFRRAEEGDLNGAIRELREAIEIHGPTAVRLNNLGCLLTKQESHAESLEVFFEAERLGGRHLPIFRANQALALRKLGRPEEALPIIEEVRERLPRESVIACHHCLILADLGRFDVARAQLRAAESMPRVLVFPKSARESRAKLLKECRDRLTVKPISSNGDLADWT